MGMSTHIVGLRDLDGKFKQMIDVKLACEKAGIDYPQGVSRYFDGNESEPVIYLEENLREVDISKAVSEYLGESKNGYTVDITKLPKDVNEIRFYNSY